MIFSTRYYIRLVVLLVISLVYTLPLFATGEFSVETIPNVRLTNRLNHVSNPDKIISTKDIRQINQVLNLVEDSLGIEVAVVAVNSIGDNDARMFATDLFKHWGLGKKDLDNGLLIQLITEPNQRSVIFETGYGIEGVLPDAICYKLQQKYMIPALKQGDYSEGMLRGVIAVSKYLLASDYERKAMAGDTSKSEDDEFLWLTLTMFIGFLGIVCFAFYMKYRPKKCPFCGKKTYAYVGEDIVREATRFSEGLADDVYRCRNCGYTQRKRHTISRIRNNGGGGPIIMGGGGSDFGGFSGGGSWGGGSSGGGGSMSRF